MTHSISRRTTLGVVVALTALGASIGAATVADTAAAKRPACAQLRENQRVRVTFSWRYSYQHTRPSNGKQIVRKVTEETRPFATLSMGGAACKPPGARWRMIDPVSFGYTSVGINEHGDLVGDNRMKGWGIGIRKATGGFVPEIVLQVMHCGKGNFFSTIKAITGVPIPRVGFWPSLALWGAGQVLPNDKVVCGDVGQRLLWVYADNHGALRVHDVTAHPAAEVQTRLPSNQNPWTSTQRFDVLPIAVTGP
jgi:hypothetical protein